MKGKSQIAYDDDNRIVARQSGGESVTEIVQRAKEKGWTSINLRGDLELRRAVWLEASTYGLSVKGYEPSPADRALLENLKRQKKDGGDGLTMRADVLADDYSKRVVPYLKKQYDDVRERRRKAGVSRTELDRAYGLNSPSSTYARELDDKFFRIKGALSRAMDDLQAFSRLGRKEVHVTETFEDGLPRFVLSDKAVLVPNSPRMRRHLS